MQRKIPVLNHLYICSALNFSKLMYKAMAGYTYQDDQGKITNSAKDKIHRFARDYEVAGSPFCMMIVTDKPSKKNAQAFFDKVNKTMIDNKFKALVGSADLKPLDTGIVYGEKA